MNASRQDGDTPLPRVLLAAAPDDLSAGVAMLTAPPRRARLVGFVTPTPERPAALPAEHPWLGAIEAAPALREKTPFDRVVLMASPEDAARLRTPLDRAGIPVSPLPTLADLLGPGADADGAGRAMLPLIRSIDMLALVGRTGRPVDEEMVASTITGRRVLITGAGGSIGAELAMLAARFAPDALILMDRSENALFEIDRRVRERFPDVERIARLHDVVDAEATIRHFVDAAPDIIFHTAAHKHVPMMEDHPAQAIDNNLFGTKSVADAAIAVGAERFVFISTDKAVNPTSVMGATKRLAEHYVRSQSGRGDTAFRVVRFGNVLGSACSVLPIWARQIAEGEPLTITDPEMTRYFMTIPEAASLVLQAGAMPVEQANGADVFVLDMGQPVRIEDLAIRFIEAHGLCARPPGSASAEAPGEREAVRIVHIGARPGEKIHEELAHAEERLEPTATPGLLSWRGGPVDFDWTTRMVAALSSVRKAADRRLVLDALAKWTPVTQFGSTEPEKTAQVYDAA